jgi:cytochrome c5|tara:strand:- start:1352 stop:1738 length:387 start_codon:yes stop_codon:yes gene_type:complete
MSKELNVLTIKKVMSKVGLFVLVASFATVISADNSQQQVQLAQLTDGFDAEATYMMSCFACHSTGAAGAPKVGDGNADAWAPRMEKGMEAVVANAINGLNTMPPKGLCFTCTDEDLAALVTYMVSSSQ